MLRKAGICAVLLLTTIAVYLPVGQNTFVNYDDPQYIHKNPHVRNGLTWSGVRWAFTTNHISNWHPLTWVSHMTDVALFGHQGIDAARGHHWMNLAWHCANVILLFLLLTQMTGAPWRSAVVAALFAIHPLHVESVAWISERKDVLSTFFVLCAMLAYLRYVKSSLSEGTGDASTADDSENALKATANPGSLPRLMWYALLMMAFALSLLAKAMYVTLPFLLLLIDLWPLRRLRRNLAIEQKDDTAGPTEKSGAIRWRDLPQLIIEKLPLLGMAIGSSVITFMVQRSGGAVSSLRDSSLSYRLGNSLVAYMRYIGKTFYPVDLAIIYPHPVGGHWPIGVVIGAGLALLIITGLVVWRLRANPKQDYLAVGWLWFLGTLVPVIGLVQVGMQSMADRYTYWPIIGLFIALVWWIGDLGAKYKFAPPALGAAACVILLTLGIMTWQQVGTWRDSGTVFKHTLAVTGPNYTAHMNLGKHLRTIKEHAQAANQYQKALKIAPHSAMARVNLANTLIDLGRKTEARDLFQTALALAPNDPDANNNYASMLLGERRFAQAVPYFQRAFEADPDNLTIHFNLAHAQLHALRTQAAITNYRQILARQGRNGQAHSELAIGLSRLGQFTEARKHIKQAIAIGPKSADLYNNFGMIAARQGALAEAVEQFTLALKLDARHVEAKANLDKARRMLSSKPPAK